MRKKSSAGEEKIMYEQQQQQMASDDERMPSKFQVWKLAARPHTLTASIVPVVVGYALTLQLLLVDNDDIIIAADMSGVSMQSSLSSCPSSSWVNQILTSSDERINNEGSCLWNTKFHNLLLLLLPLAIQFALFAMLIQVSTNLHNDYADFIKGADTKERVGQARATQRGWLTPNETCRGCALCMVGAFLVGMVYLVPISDECSSRTVSTGGTGEENTFMWLLAWRRRYSYQDPVMLFIVISSLFNAVAYTGGPFPLGYIGLGNVSIGYSGLGDLFVFLYFGVVATVGVPYLYLTKISCRRLLPLFTTSNTDARASWQFVQLLKPAFLHSIPVGCLATAIIVVNNLRDRHTDVHAGKRTLAVRFGATFAKIEYFALVVGSYICCIFRWLDERNNDHSSKHVWITLLPLLSFPMAVPQLKAVAFGGKDGQDLNVHVGGTAKVQMAYCLLLALGMAASSRR